METSAKTAVSDHMYLISYILMNATLVQLNVNDIFLAIAKKLPKDGEGGAAGAGGIR